MVHTKKKKILKNTYWAMGKGEKTVKTSRVQK